MNRGALETALRQAGSYAEWRKLLTAAFERHRVYFGHGTTNATDEASWLIAHELGWRTEAWSEPPDARLIGPVVELAAERIERRVPLAYLLGETWFAGLRFKVDPRVLIPRSPLAELLERRFEPWCELSPGDRVLEIGTGSGCIAIAAAHYCPGILVDATDTSSAALEVAAANVALHGLDARVRLYEADVYPPRHARYRVIISNPPYVPASELEELPREYEHEPAAALAGGDDGLAVVERILADAWRFLTPDGLLILEVGGQEVFETRYPRLPVVWLTFERGGDGVFLITRSELEQHEPHASG